MLDCNDLLVSIKTAAMDAVNASKQTGIVFGNVISVDPLKINIEQKLTLSMAQLVLTRNVTDYTVFMTVNHQTNQSQGSVDLTHKHSFTGSTSNDLSHSHSCSGDTENGGQKNLTHSHNYEGKKTFLMHNALKIGEKVIMIQALGGQKFIVMDRVAL